MLQKIENEEQLKELLAAVKSVDPNVLACFPFSDPYPLYADIQVKVSSTHERSLCIDLYSEEEIKYNKDEVVKLWRG